MSKPISTITIEALRDAIGFATAACASGMLAGPPARHQRVYRASLSEAISCRSFMHCSDGGARSLQA